MSSCFDCCYSMMGGVDCWEHPNSSQTSALESVGLVSRCDTLQLTRLVLKKQEDVGCCCSIQGLRKRGIRIAYMSLRISMSLFGARESLPTCCT